MKELSTMTKALKVIESVTVDDPSAQTANLLAKLRKLGYKVRIVPENELTNVEKTIGSAIYELTYVDKDTDTGEVVIRTEDQKYLKSLLTDHVITKSVNKAGQLLSYSIQNKDLSFLGVKDPADHISYDQIVGSFTQY